jgi:hypothetical protein
MCSSQLKQRQSIANQVRVKLITVFVWKILRNSSINKFMSGHTG